MSLFMAQAKISAAHHLENILNWGVESMNLGRLRIQASTGEGINHDKVLEIHFSRVEQVVGIEEFFK